MTRIAYAVSLAFFIAIPAAAHRPLPGQEGHYGPMLPPYTQASPTVSGTWTPINSAFPGKGTDTALLMTDGTVMMHDNCTSDWYRLTPDMKGSYIAGSWHHMQPMPNGYGPLYFASAVLLDGRMIVNGGEMNFNGSVCAHAETNLGAIYDPVANTWNIVLPPPGWNKIGDASSVVLQNGDYMLAGPKRTPDDAALLTWPGLTWVATGSGKADSNGEEGWTLLPDGNVLTVDINLDRGLPTPSELYSPATGAWTRPSNAVNILVDPAALEIGPAVLLPNGYVFQAGANPCGAPGCPAHTGIFHLDFEGWVEGADFPKISGEYYDVADGPASILPDGNVLVQASPSYACMLNGKRSAYCSPSHFFEFDGSAWTFTRVNEPANAPHLASFEGRMLALPTGAVLWSGGDVEFYAPKGAPKAAWLPTITSLSATSLRIGGTGYTVFGTQFNGVSNGAAFGDDAQMNSNYPLVRIKNEGTGDVCYARSYNFTPTATTFDMPAQTPPVWEHPCETGLSNLQIVVNGIASKSVQVNVVAQHASAGRGG